MDNTNFLSEFNDPVRRILITQIVKSEAYLRLERPNFYALWFGDIERLVKWSSSDEKAIHFRGIDLTHLIPLFDVPNICEFQLQCVPENLLTYLIANRGR